MTAAEQQAAFGLAVLEQHMAAIIGGEADQAIGYKPSTWDDWLDRASWSAPNRQQLFTTLRVDPAAIASGRIHYITRNQVRAMAETTDTAEARLQLLAATLIWGRGRSNGRMRDHMVNVLDRGNADGIDKVLAATSDLATRATAAAAYRAWTLRGLRRSFLTKWLWAASCKHPPAERCLVLDDRVLATLNGPLQWSTKPAAESRRWANRYGAYVEQCHQWAAALSDKSARTVTAEDVEWALFEANGDLRRLDRHG